MRLESGNALPDGRGSVGSAWRCPTVVHNKRMHGETVAIFGSGGQLGVELKTEFTARGYHVAAFERTTADITDQHAVERVLARCDASMVINAAAYNQVDVAEKEPQAAFLVNGLAVRNLAMACRQADARLIHFSTDYVFDGLAGRAYTEDDTPRPLGAYAVSKLAGELYARAYLDKPLIIRTSGVYGPGGLDTARGNFVELMLRLAGLGQPIRVVEDHVASPTFAPALASRTADLVEKGVHGIVHAGGGTPISWFDWAVKIFDAAGVKPPVKPTNEREFRTAARRPKYSALSNAKMESLGIAPMPRLDDAIRMYLERRAQRSVGSGSASK
jgi:dTDP-4-dehydrorhamnose reductase